MSNSVCVVLFAIVLSFNCIANCVKLNERRILLPYNCGVNTNFTLEANNDNCYQWTSSRVDVANVEALDDPKGCSRKALVTVVSTLPKRQSTVVTATDKASGSVIRCDVEIDAIDSIEIITTTREIVLEDLPEILEIKAKNAKNDTFSSIGGIQFEWTLSPVDIVRYRTWSSSSYIGPPFVHFWESRDAKGSAILVEGIRTGSAKVTARIVSDDYRNVKAAQTSLHVIANIGLIPSNVVYLMRGSKIEFRAEMAKQGPRVALTLPSPQYYLKVLDPNIAQLAEESSQVEAMNEGHTSLLLLDRNVVTSESSRQPTTDIHVMRPSYMTIHVTPGENFALCEFTSYVVTFTVHDDWHHRLFPTDNLNIKVTFPSRYFHINESSTNGTHHTIRTINSGNCKITAQLIGAGTAKLAVPLEHSQEVTIYRTLILTPNHILLPWIPSIKPSYTVFVTASGATGQYRWVTNNSLVSTVNYKQEQSSRVTIVTRGEGEALISCQDIHNSVFSANMRVSVQPLVDIEILPAVLETHIGGNVILPIAVYGIENDLSKTKRLFDDCSQIPFEVEIIEKTRVRYDPNNIMAGMGKRSCRGLSFECISTGNTRVWIRYKTETGKELLSTTAIIGCHLPLRAVHPEELAVMPSGASIDVAFEGGPRPWSLHSEGHYTRLSTSEPNIVSSIEVIDRYRYNKDLHVFRVQCLQYGETQLDLNVGNLASPTLPNPANARAQVKIVCIRPTSMIIKPKLKSSCPLSAPQDSVFPIEKNQNPEIEVEVKDEFGRNFYNISTLNIIWNIDGIGSFETQNGVKEIVNGAKGYFAITRNLQIIRELKSNSVKISAEINGYKTQFRDRFGIQTEIELISVEEAKLDSEKISIFNHPKQKSVVNILKGSGYFGIEAESERQFINISFKQQSKSFSIEPKAMGEGVIEINDLCLTSYGTTELYYSVVEATDIRIDVIDKFQLGTVVDGYLSVIDNNGDEIHVSNHKLIDLTPIISNKILNISNLTVFDEWKSTFKLKGEELGSSSLSFVSRTNYIESPTLNIQVFAPLLIIPSNVTLIVGNYFEVTCIGGPQPQRTIEFSSIDETIARVDSNGLIVGLKLGKTKLLARVLSVDNNEYSRSEVDLYVVSLNKIKIFSHTSQLRIGSKLPLHLLGGNEFETAFSFGTSIPSLRITWSVSNENIAAIEEVFQTSGIVDKNSNSISVRLRAVSTGVVSVKVTVESKISTKDISLQQIANNIVLSDTIQIHVFPSFSIVSNGNNIDERVVLMSPNSQLSLQSNRIGEADSQFQLLNATNIELSCGLDRCLKAGNSPDVSSLVVRTNEKFGVTLTSVFSIRVDKISYLMVNPIDNFISGKTVEVFPIGSDSQIRITFHDNIGKQFDSIRSEIRWTLSRSDLMSISRGSDNTTLRVRSLKEGRTLVKVYDTENDIFDYFSVDIGSVIEPKDLNLSVGEVVCLQCKLKTGKSGFWFVENPFIGDIEKDSGVFVARSGGHTSVGWKSSDGLTTYSPIDVMPLKKFMFDTKGFKGITNIITQSIPIVIVSHAEGIRRRHCGTSIDVLGLDSINSPFSCEITFDNSPQIKSIWNIGIRFDINSGQWMCRFEPKLDLNYAEMSLINANVSISVIMSSAVRELDSVNRPLIHTISVPFVPAFDVSPKQVILSLDQTNTRLLVHSVPSVLQELTIITSNSDVIDVSKSEIIENTLKIIIYLKNADIFTNDVSNLHILLNSKITKQTQRIPIQIKLFRQNIQQISPIYQILKDNLILLITFTTILSFIIYLVFNKYFQPKVTPSGSTLLSNTSGSPFMADFQSPVLKGHRALNYSPTQPQSPNTSTPRVGRPLYSVSNT